MGHLFNSKQIADYEVQCNRCKSVMQPVLTILGDRETFEEKVMGETCSHCGKPPDSLTVQQKLGIVTGVAVFIAAFVAALLVDYRIALGLLAAVIAYRWFS